MIPMLWVLTLTLAAVIVGLLHWLSNVMGKLGEHEGRIESLERGLAASLGMEVLPWREGKQDSWDPKDPR